MHDKHDFIFDQSTTHTTIQGWDNLCAASTQWEADFSGQYHNNNDNGAADAANDDNDSSDVRSAVERVSVLSVTDQNQVVANSNSTSSTTTTTTTAMIRVRWNVTWIPWTASWLVAVAPHRRCEYVSYTHLSHQVSQFSWRAVGDFWKYYFQTRGTLRLPLACIQGTSDLEFRKVKQQSSPLSSQPSMPQSSKNCTTTDSSYGYKLVSVQQQQQQQHQQNLSSSSLWYDTVATCLPWSSVPGSNVLQVDETAEGPLAAVIFLSITATTMLLVAGLLAPELLGQSLWPWATPNYITRPEDVGVILY